MSLILGMIAVLGWLSYFVERREVRFHKSRSDYWYGECRRMTDRWLEMIESKARETRAAVAGTPEVPTPQMPRTWPEYRAVLDVLIRAGVSNGTTGALDMLDALVLRAARGGSEPDTMQMADDVLTGRRKIEDVLAECRGGSLAGEPTDYTCNRCGAKMLWRNGVYCPSCGFGAVPGTEAALRETNWLGQSGMERLRLIEAAPIEMHGGAGGVEIAEIGVAELKWLCEIVRATLAGAPPESR